MKPLSSLIFAFLSLIMLACNNVSKPTSTERKHLAAKENKQIDTSQVIMAIDSSLSYKGNGFMCDSAIILTYKIIQGKDAYMPLTEKGKWIPNIINRKKLTVEQLNFMRSIFGAKKTFIDAMFACFEPRIGFVYFKNGKVIGQSCLCLTCSGVQSTAKLGNDKDFGDFGGDAEEKLTAFYNSLKM